VGEVRNGENKGGSPGNVRRSIAKAVPNPRSREIKRSYYARSTPKGAENGRGEALSETKSRHLEEKKLPLFRGKRGEGPGPEGRRPGRVGERVGKKSFEHAHLPREGTGVGGKRLTKKENARFGHVRSPSGRRRERRLRVRAVRAARHDPERERGGLGGSLKLFHGKEKRRPRREGREKKKTPTPMGR